MRKDFRNLDRVYLPQDCLDRHGATIAMLGEAKAPPALRAVFHELAQQCLVLLDEGATLPDLIDDTRLSLEIAAIHRLAVVLSKGLLDRDPLSEKVHHGKAAFALIALRGVARPSRAARSAGGSSARPCKEPPLSATRDARDRRRGRSPGAARRRLVLLHAMRLLPKSGGEAMYAVYAFCGPSMTWPTMAAARDVRRTELDRWRADIDALYAGRPVARTATL